MRDMVWLGGCGATIFLVMLSITARRWWPLAYVFALLFGMGTGTLLWDWPEPLRNAWWLLGLIYSVALPIARTVAARHRALYGE